MITHKKQQVLVNSFLDKQPTASMWDTRNVYEDAQGKFWVTFLGQKCGREVTRQPDGTFVWDFHIVTLPSYTSGDIFGA